MFWSLLEQGKNRQACFSETEESATARTAGKLAKWPPIFPRAPTFVTSFAGVSHEISERHGEPTFGVAHAPFGDAAPSAVTSVSERFATIEFVPICSHKYIGRYISDDIVVKTVSLFPPQYSRYFQYESPRPLKDW